MQSEINLSSLDENVRSVKVASVERSICEIIQGLCIPASLSWHLVDEVYVPINYEGSFHWVLAVIVLKEICIRMNYGLFVVAYAEILSDGHQIPSSEFDSGLHRTRYVSLLWDYGVNKSSNGYISGSQDPLSPKHTFIPSEDTEMIDVKSKLSSICCLTN
ncbi:hypothetical protein FXO38_16567 [Capsicum annuum]|nr:hypothetical protein FXO37_30228 [Capsicum annuum]KAF3651534.1 hypothetical protein FXO38_16567 [Capsicum annuum]